MSSRVYLLFPPRGHEQNKTTYEVEYTVVLVFTAEEWLIYGGARAIRQSIPYSYVLLIFYCTNNIIFYHLGRDTISEENKLLIIETELNSTRTPEEEE